MKTQGTKIEKGVENTSYLRKSAWTSKSNSRSVGEAGRLLTYGCVSVFQETHRCPVLQYGYFLLSKIVEDYYSSIIFYIYLMIHTSTFTNCASIFVKSALFPGPNLKFKWDHKLSQYTVNNSFHMAECLNPILKLHNNS